MMDKKDLKQIQNKLLGPGASPDWKRLRSCVQDYMNATRRTWASVVFYLLEKGLRQAIREEETVI